MQLLIDTDTQKLTVTDGAASRTLPLYSIEAFALLSRQWLKVGWDQKYPHQFSWFGRPVIQIPEDLIRLQEVIYAVQPDVIIEAGVAHGGSLIFYASLCKAMERGRVIGIDIEIRPHNRRAIESHALFALITLLEADSAAPSTVEQVRSLLKPNEKVLIILDSNHSRDHVLAELEAYNQFVTSGSYLIVADGITYDLYDVPRGSPQWQWDNPINAVKTFLESHSEFVAETPRKPFTESALTTDISYFPSGWLRRK
ncbi:MAG: class I SAM-dependent methyltransferase [Anaerolineae bacterium]|nr:class I SAM-dependent methyltransferase [Anaerolineae bacterium]